MPNRKRLFLFAGLAALLCFVATAPHRADLRVLTHDVGDMTPHRFQAALDLGWLGFSLIVTWTSRLAR
ncbi:MAG: hypothetical protein ACOY45_16790 [Pseudomonadota bacterium]